MYIFKKLVLFFSITDSGVKDDYKAAFRRAICSVERRSSKTAYLDIDGTFCKKSLRWMFKKKQTGPAVNISSCLFLNQYSFYSCLCTPGFPLLLPFAVSTEFSVRKWLPLDPDVVRLLWCFQIKLAKHVTLLNLSENVNISDSNDDEMSFITHIRAQPKW